MKIVVVRSTKLGVIGVGEGTIPSVMHFLHRFLDIDRFELYREVKASPKLGIHYLWGRRSFFNYTFTGQLTRPHHLLAKPRGFYCEENFEYADLNSSLMVYDKACLRHPDGRPQMNGNHAYHLENKRFVAYLESLTDQLGIEKIDALVERVDQNAEGIQSLILDNGQEIFGDLFVDCSGFRSELLGKALNVELVDFSNSLFCDRAVVGGWEREQEAYHPYTTAETMDAGWCWKIEHDDLINRGYVFSSAFLDDGQAVEEYQQKNPKAKVGKVIRFDSGVRRRSWVKNVVAIGNAVGFVEPLEATAIGLICDSIVRLVGAIKSSDGQIFPIQREVFNLETEEKWNTIREFLALHYKFNTRLDTPFWQAARADVDIGNAQRLVDYYQCIGPDFSALHELKANFFTAEGYLVMLLGQDVPHAHKVQFSNEELARWAQIKSRLRQLADDAFDVPEFLALVRSPDAREKFVQCEMLKSDRQRQSGKMTAAMQVGELQWH